MQESLLTTSEAASYLRMTTPALAQLRYRRVGPDFIRLGKRSIRYRLGDLEEWISRGVVSLPDF